MKINNLIDIIKMGSISISKILLKNYKKLGLSSDEFIFIVYLINEGNNINLDIGKIANEIGVNTNDVLCLLECLKDKNIISVIVNKNDKKMINEYISLDPLYEKISVILMEYINNNDKDNDKDFKDNSYIFETFEKEFGRTLSPMEYEIINTWIEGKINSELILGALKEAIFNGVANLRYIDKIIYEWNKKGFKNINDVKNHNINRKDKKEKVEVFSYNWLEEDENE